MLGATMSQQQRIIFLVVSALAASSAAPFCGICANGGPPPMVNTFLQSACSESGAVINDIIFSSYGDSTGTCPSFTRGKCDAATSMAIVQAACVGQRECIIYPNTTTFGDPCFGTAKTLTVVMTCSTGEGVSICSTPPPPPVPTISNFTAQVNVNFGVNVSSATVLSSASIQVVSHHALWRTSPIASTAWTTLSQLGAKNVRFVPWVPYAQHGVAELSPPQSGGRLCGPQNWEGGSGQIEPITLDCGPIGGVIEHVDFASYGNPSGNCGNYVSGSCEASNSSAIVATMCVGKSSCIVPTAQGGIFGTPCGASPSWLAVQLQCSNHSAIITSWNFTLPDQFLQDFWDAAGGDDAIPLPNFSTQPTWLYSPTDYNWNADPSQPWDYSRGSYTACNNTLLGEYYGRLYGYFATGSMVDEAGVTHTRPGGALDIRQIEIFNEVDYEHGYTVEGYTEAFDSVVRNIRASFDTDKKIRFVGMNLPNIDDASKISMWATYFLNASNHAPDVGSDALNYIGYHAYPSNGGYTKDPTTFARMFDYADSFISGVLEIDAVIESLSPNTRTYLDETGTDMDGVLTAGLTPPDNAPRYWVAAASYFAYIFARVSNESSTVVQVGASQFMDAPGQEPSVTLLDWSSGLGTARFWVVRLLLESIQFNDVFLPTSVNIVTPGADADALFAIGIATPDMLVKKIMLINKRNAWANVTVECGGSSACNCLSLKTIDEFTRLSPARIDQCSVDNNIILMAPYATTVMSIVA